MDNLRILLLIIAVALFIAVYLWTVFISRRKRRVTNRRAPDWNHTPEPVFEPRVDDLPADPVFDDIGDMHITREPELETVQDAMMDEPMIMSEPEDELLPGTQTAFLFDDEASGEAKHKPSETDTSDATAEKAGNEIILMLGLTPVSGESFDGDRAMKALRETGLQHGDMNIYHHYGVGQMQDRTPLFSLASMFEPGSFDPHHLLDSLSTRGYVLFMRADGQHDDRASLELMLNTAERLAHELDAQVLDRTRKPLTSQTIEAMRKQLEHA